MCHCIVSSGAARWNWQAGKGMRPRGLICVYKTNLCSFQSCCKLGTAKSDFCEKLQTQTISHKGWSCRCTNLQMGIPRGIFPSLGVQILPWRWGCFQGRANENVSLECERPKKSKPMREGAEQKAEKALAKALPLAFEEIHLWGRRLAQSCRCLLEHLHLLLQSLGLSVLSLHSASDCSFLKTCTLAS